jgi:hypothetical protein
MTQADRKLLLDFLDVEGLPCEGCDTPEVIVAKLLSYAKEESIEYQARERDAKKELRKMDRRVPEEAPRKPKSKFVEFTIRDDHFEGGYDDA